MHLSIHMRPSYLCTPIEPVYAFSVNTPQSCSSFYHFGI
jgi:hypothetical protein